MAEAGSISITNILMLLAGLGVFLVGMNMMSTSMEKLANTSFNAEEHRLRSHRRRYPRTTSSASRRMVRGGRSGALMRETSVCNAASAIASSG